MFFFFRSGWLDDALFIQREGDKRGGSSGVKGLGSGSNAVENDGRRNVLWNNFSSNHAFTTGRQQRQNDVNFGGKVRPKGPSQTLKVNHIHSASRANAFNELMWNFCFWPLFLNSNRAN